jgi:hypothetical protein
MESSRTTNPARAAANESALAAAAVPALIPPPVVRRSAKLTKDDPFWGDQPAILFHTARLIEFFPSADQTVEERLNSITRLVIYIGIFLSVYHAQFGPLQMAGLAIAGIYAMWRNHSVLRQEHFNGDVCTPPTPENPMMNFLAMDPAERPPACQGPEVQAEAAQLLEYQLFEDVDDLFARASSQRQFVTNPVTTRIADTRKFAEALHGDDVRNCKSDNYCPPYIDPRSNRQLIPEDIEREATVYGYGA